MMIEIKKKKKNKFTLPNFSICTTGTPFDKSTNNKRKQFIDNTTDVNYEKVKLNQYDVNKTKQTKQKKKTYVIRVYRSGRCVHRVIAAGIRCRLTGLCCRGLIGALRQLLGNVLVDAKKLQKRR